MQMERYSANEALAFISIFPVPLKMILPPGMDLTEYMKAGATKNEKMAD